MENTEGWPREFAQLDVKTYYKISGSKIARHCNQGRDMLSEPEFRLWGGGGPGEKPQ